MRKINSKKGLTLVEIIVAVTILSILVAFFLQAIVKHYIQLQSAKRVTENVFYASKEVEHDMQSIKDILMGVGVASSKPLPPSTTTQLFTGLFQREVTYYPVIHSINSNKTIRCVVADVRPPEFEVPAIIDIDAYLTVDNIMVDGAYAAQAENSSVQVRTEVTVDRGYLLQTMLCRWYKTNSTFPMRWTEYTDPHDIDFTIGRSIPQVLDDFEIIPGQISPTLLVDADMAGHHVVCIMTPASHENRMGRSVPTMPIYIYGLPIIDNLVAHYDASLIDIPFIDFDEVAWLGRVALRWRDISNMVNAHAGVVGNDPVVGRALLPTLLGQSFPVEAQYVDFSDRGMMSPNSLPVAPPFTMFAMVRVKDKARGTIVSRGTAWFFDAGSYPEIVEDQWYILGLNSDGMRTVGSDAIPSINVDVPMGGGGGTIRIGGFEGSVSDIDLIELVIYNGAMSPSSPEWLKITQYLGKKYNIY